jgi:hypothetical protein
MVVVTSRPEGTGADDDQATVVCTRDRLRELAIVEESRRTLFFTVDRAHFLRTCSQINSTDLEK